MTVSAPRNYYHGDQVSRFTGLFCTTVKDKAIRIACIRCNELIVINLATAPGRRMNIPNCKTSHVVSHFEKVCLYETISLFNGIYCIFQLW